MIIYRPHRGSLANAMEEVKEFNDELEMKEYIVKQWNGHISFDDIVIADNPHNDDRIGWIDTRYVCTKKLGEDDYIKKYGHPQCIGMCATEYIKK